jgi:hypothetical protein
MFRTHFVSRRRAVVGAALLGLAAVLAVALTAVNEAAARPDKAMPGADAGKKAPGTDAGKKTPDAEKPAPAKAFTTGIAPRRKPQAAIGPQTAPAQLDWDWNPIDFRKENELVRVFGYMHLTLRRDGSYTFSGHFHNDGVFSWDTSLAYVLKDSKGKVYTFVHQGHVQGLGIGSRDDDWSVSGKNPAIAANWDSIAAGMSHGAARTDANLTVLADVLRTVVLGAAEFILVAGPFLFVAL